MKDFLQMLAYLAMAMTMIGLLVVVTTSDTPSWLGLTVALLLVVVLPVILMVMLVKRKNTPS